MKAGGIGRDGGGGGGGCRKGCTKVVFTHDEMGGICKQREGTEFIICRKCIHDQPCTSCLFPWQLVNSLALK